MKFSRLITYLTLTIATVLIVGCSGSGVNDEKSSGSRKAVYSGIAGNSFPVTTGTDNEDQPAIAYDRNANKYLTVWADYRNGKDADIWGKVCDASPVGDSAVPKTGLYATPPVCGAEFAVATGAGNQWQPKVAFDYTSDKYLVVFADTAEKFNSSNVSLGIYSQIYGRFISNAGLPDVAGVFAISRHLDVADPSQIEPEVIYNDFKNTFTVAWLATSNYDSDDYPAPVNSTSATFSPTWTSGDTTTLISGGTYPNINAAANAVISVKFSNGIPVTGYTVNPPFPTVNNAVSSITLNATSNAIGISDPLTISYADASSGMATDGFLTSTNPPVAPATAGAFTANDGGTIAAVPAQKSLTDGSVVAPTSLALAYFFINSTYTIPATNILQSQKNNGINFGVDTGSNVIGLPKLYWTSFPKSTVTWAARSWQAFSPLFINNVYSGANTGANVVPANRGTYSVTIKNGATDYTNEFTVTVSGGTLFATLNPGSVLIGRTTPLTVTYTPIKNLFGPVSGSGCANSFGPVPYIPIDHAGTNLVAYANVSTTGNVTIPVDSAYSQLVSKSLTDDGGTITQTWTVSDQETKPRLAYNPLDGNPFLVWSGSQFEEALKIAYKKGDSNVCTYSAIFIKNPTKAATPQKIYVRRFINNLANDLSLGTSAFFPAISIDPTAKRMLVSWEEQGAIAATGKDINAQLVDLTNFVLYGSLITVSNAAGDQSSPSAAFDTVNQRHLIAWEDARNQSANISNIDIYGQFVDPQGNLSGGNVPISVDAGNQLSPVLAFGDVDFRQFLIIWKDAQDAGNSDLWGQLIKYSTLPQLVIADSTGSPILNGALDFGSVAVGLFKDIPIKLRNDGNTTLTLSPVLPPDAPFSFVTPTPVTINPGTAYDMVVRFSPTAAGSFAGNTGNNYKMSLASNGGNTVLYFSGTGVGINPLTITTASLPDILPTVTADTVIATLVGSGGVAPYTWSVTLPAALVGKLDFNTTTGVLTQKTGVAAIIANSYSIPFTVTDSNTPTVSATRTLTLNVGSIGITSTVLKTWTQDSVGYSDTLSATGTTGTPTWTAPATGVGALPTGLTLNANGSISGKPTVSGSFTVSVTLTDVGGTNSVVTKSIPITINPAPSIITSSLAAGVKAQSYNQTLTMTGGTLPVTWSLSGSLPPGLTFNTGTGAITGTPTAARTSPYSFAITVTDATQATATKSLEITINEVLAITSATTLPNALSGQSYITTLTGAGGTLPYTWSQIGLPAGFSLSPYTGVLTATPALTGTFSFTATLTDANNTTVARVFTITVNAPVSITTATLPNWTVNSTSAYIQALAATGGNGSYTWSVTSGSGAGSLIPVPGLTLNATTGALTGTPTAIGTFVFTVKATDGSTPALTGNKQFTVTINPLLLVTTTAMADGVIGTVYSQTLLSSGGTTPVSWALSGGTTLPAGLYLDALTGVISGLPTGPTGTVNFTIGATDSGGATATKALSIKINDAPATLHITTVSINDMKTGVPVSLTLQHDGTPATKTYTWSVSGNVPPGIMPFYPASREIPGGTINGTPTKAGDYQFDIFVTDGTQTATKHYNVSVRDPLLITTSTLKSWDTGLVGYSDTLSATGGRPTYSWSVIPGTLPLGLSLNPASGVISGTPTAAGTYTFTVKLIDSALAPDNLTPQPEAVTKQLSIVITSPMTITLTPDPTAVSPNTNALYQGKAAALTLSTVGGTQPVSWTSTALPQGLALDPLTGIISGIPANASTIASVITATDSTGRTATRTIVFVVNAPLTISNASLPAWTKDASDFSQTLTGTGGVSPYKFAVSAGSALPAGLKLVGAVVNGTPTATGNYTVAFDITDANGVVSSKSFPISINAPMTLITSSVQNGTKGSLYSQPLTLSGGTAPFTWSVDTLPPGLVMDALTGAITGVPTTSGNTKVTVSVTDATAYANILNKKSFSPLSITIFEPLTIAAPTDASLSSLAGTAFSLSLSTGSPATGNAPYSWSSTGSMPSGLALDPVTGVINGTPVTAGAYNIAITVRDTDGRTATRTIILTVVSSVSVTTVSLPAWTVNKLYTSQTLAATGGNGTYTWSITAGNGAGTLTPAPGLNLAAATGVISGTPSLAGTYTFTVTAADKVNGVLKGTRQLTIVINPPLVVSTTSLADAIAGTIYSQQLLYSGGTSPVTWTLANGTKLPEGLTLDSLTGAVSGLPTGSSGVSTFDVIVTDASGTATPKAGLTIAVNGSASTLVIDPSTSILTTVKANAPFNTVTLLATGGSSPYTWSIVGGALPVGLVLNGNGGTISGVPTLSGNYTFMLRVTDSSTPKRSADKLFSVTVTDPLAISTSTLLSGKLIVPYSDTLVGSGGKVPYTWSLKPDASLPSWLKISPAGIISGTPTATGTIQFSVQLTDNNQTTIEKQLQIAVSDPLTISTTKINSFTVNTSVNTTPQSYTLNVKGGSGSPYVWSSTILPAGLTLSSTGIVSGYPTTPGSVNVVFTVKDIGGNEATKQLLVTVAPPVQITTTQVKAWTQGVNGYSQTLSAVGGSPIGGVDGTYTWSWAGSSINGTTIYIDDLPPGLSLNSATGEISGSPSTARASAYAFNATAMDNNGVSATRLYYLQINPVILMQTASLSSGTEGVLYNAQLQMTGGTAPFKWSVSGTLPSGLTLDSLSGLITGIPAANTNGSYPITIRVTDAAGAFVERPLSLTIAATLKISTTSLASVLNNSPYNQTLDATGGSVPYQWTISSGNLPTGLSLNLNTGVISGTATVAGKFDFVVQVADAGNRMDIKTLSIDIQAPLSITSPITLAPWTQAKAGYQNQLTAIGASGKYTWAINSTLSGGQFPPGLSLTADGLIKDATVGVGPSAAGVYTFSVTATDKTTASITGSKQFTLAINPPLNISTVSLPDAAINALYAKTLNVSGGTTPVLWSITSGALPTGLSLDSLTGIISGIPTVASVTPLPTFVATATDAAGSKITSVALSIKVLAAPTLSITTTTLLTAPLNALYSQRLIGEGGRMPYTWSVVQGSLPTGLTIAASTGIISGTPTAQGPFVFIINLTDADGIAATKTLTIATSSSTKSLVIDTTALLSGEINKTYTSTTLSASGGNGPRTWTISSGRLPTGISLAPDTGVLSGTPTAGGNFDLIVQVTDADKNSATQTLSIVVVDPTVSGGSLQFTDGTSQISSLSYGNAYKGTYNKKTVTLKNTSTVPISIVNATSNSSAFTVSGTKFIIPAKGSTTITTLDIAFIPAQISAYSGVITLTDATGSTYQLPVSGSGIGVNVELKSAPGTVSYFNTLATTSLPILNKPADFITQSAADFQIAGVTPGATVTVAVTFASLPVNPVFYKIVVDQWLPLTGATVSGNVVTFTLTDNGSMDSDATAGVIRDPLVVGTTSTAGGGTGTNVAPPTSGGGGGGGCFIATAAYGSYLDPHVMVLRHFRDNVLLQSQAGRAFVDLYYHYSPPIAHYIAQHDVLRMLLRLALTPLVFMVKIGWFNVGFLLFAGFAVVRKMKNKISMLKLDAIK
jgi:hypothetical protein